MNTRTCARRPPDRLDWVEGPATRKEAALTTELDWEQTLFTFILHAGNARSKAKEAAEYAETGAWDEAAACMVEAEAEQLKAHEGNADIIRMEAGGQAVPFSLLLMHP